VELNWEVELGLEFSFRLCNLVKAKRSILSGTGLNNQCVFCGLRLFFLAGPIILIFGDVHLKKTKKRSKKKKKRSLFCAILGLSLVSWGIWFDLVIVLISCSNICFR